MVSYPSPPPVCTDPWSLTHSPTCLYRPMVSYSSPHLSVQTHGLLPIPPPVCTYPWSLTHPPHLSVQTHGLLPIPPTCLYRPMVSCLAPPPKSGSRACKIVLTTSLIAITFRIQINATYFLYFSTKIRMCRVRSIFYYT